MFAAPDISPATDKAEWEMSDSDSDLCNRFRGKIQVFHPGVRRNHLSEVPGLSWRSTGGLGWRKRGRMEGGRPGNNKLFISSL